MNERPDLMFERRFDVQSKQLCSEHNGQPECTGRVGRLLVVSSIVKTAPTNWELLTRADACGSESLDRLPDASPWSGRAASRESTFFDLSCVIRLDEQAVHRSHFRKSLIGKRI